MTKGVLFFSTEAAAAFPEASITSLRQRVDLTAIIPNPDRWRDYQAELRDAEVIVTGWGAPKMDAEFLAAAPNLKTVFYAGGSVRYFTTEAFWERGVRVTTAQAINAIPVSEYTLATVLLALKRFWHYARLTREQRTFPVERPLPGAYRATVGLVSYGMIARLVRERLRAFALNVIVYDPFLSAEDADAEDVTRVSLEDLFAQADVVSLHTPQLPQTLGMVRGAHLSAMKPGATFINTARGEIVNEPEMIAVLQQRPDLQAVLDVTAPEPPVADSLLYRLPNVALTPHLAGSVGPECQRMGEAMLDELDRYLAGRPLRWELTPQSAALLA